MQLGALMKVLGDEARAGEALEALGDLVLFNEVRAMGETFEESPAEYVAGASRRFASLANDKDWLAMMNALERSDVPGQTALERMVRWALARDITETQAPQAHQHACGCGGHH